MPDGPTAPGEGRALVEPLRVTIVGADAALRRQLLGLLTNVVGIEVVGCAESQESSAIRDVGLPVNLVVHGEADGRTPPASAPPELAKRQRDVLVAYTASNDLVTVLARRIGMTPETFRTHLRRIRVKYEKVGRPAPTRRDLYVRAVEDGLVPPPS
jgi:DNA-binding CsgD family transcriptional regulator